MTKRPTSVPGPSRSKTPPLPSTGRANTLGMTSVELEAIYEQLDSGTGDSSHRRQSSRLSFRQPSVGVEIIQPGGGQTQITVACRNLSRTGLGFLHSSYVHVGTRVVLTLTHRTALRVRVAAKVMRCRHVTRTVHDVGVMFDEPINVRDFMELDKPVAAICHGPWLLVEADVVRGRTITSWPSLETDVRNAGGVWVDKQVQIDQKLLTSRRPDDLPAFCAKLVELLADAIDERRLDKMVEQSFPASDPLPGPIALW